MIRDLKVFHDPWRAGIINWYSWFHHSILRDFEMQSSEWLGSPIASDLGIWFAIWCLVLAFHDIVFFKYSSYLLIFLIRENEIFIYMLSDPQLLALVNRARDPPVRPSAKSIVNFSTWRGSKPKWMSGIAILLCHPGCHPVISNDLQGKIVVALNDNYLVYYNGWFTHDCYNHGDHIETRFNVLLCLLPSLMDKFFSN